MTDDENLGALLDESYLAYQRQVTVKHLGNRTHLTLGQISKMCTHPTYGEIVATITLDELLELRAPSEASEEEEEEQPTQTSKSAKKASGAKKKATRKKADKKASSTTKKGVKADKGKPKPRLDYEHGMKEVLAALKAAKEPVGRSAIEKATGFTGVQVRSFAKKLAEKGKIKILGEGGRSTKYVASASA